MAAGTRLGPSFETVATLPPQDEVNQYDSNLGNTVLDDALAMAFAVMLSLAHHLPAIGVEGVVDDPLGGIERMIVRVAEMAEALGDRFEPRPLGLPIERIVR